MDGISEDRLSGRPTQLRGSILHVPIDLSFGPPARQGDGRHKVDHDGQQRTGTGAHHDAHDAAGMEAKARVTGDLRSIPTPPSIPTVLPAPGEGW